MYYTTLKIETLSNLTWETQGQRRKGPFIKYVRKIFQKTIISKPSDTHVHIRGLEMLVFWKILRTYLMDEP